MMRITNRMLADALDQFAVGPMDPARRNAMMRTAEQLRAHPKAGTLRTPALALLNIDLPEPYPSGTDALSVGFAEDELRSRISDLSDGWSEGTTLHQVVLLAWVEQAAAELRGRLEKTLYNNDEPATLQPPDGGGAAKPFESSTTGESK